MSLGFEGFPWKAYTIERGIGIGLLIGFWGLIREVGIGFLTKFRGTICGINVEASVRMNLTWTDQFQRRLIHHEKPKADLSDLRLCG